MIHQIARNRLFIKCSFLLPILFSFIAIILIKNSDTHFKFHIIVAGILFCNSVLNFVGLLSYWCLSDKIKDLVEHLSKRNK